MLCFLALTVFSIMSIFSATHRPLAREAFDCVFRSLTFRPCNTGFKEKVRGKVVGKLLGKSVVAARIFNQHFEIISWIFFILMVGSMFWTIKGSYNYYLYGSCNGLNASGFCVFDPSGENNKISQSATQCSLVDPTEENLTLKGFDVNLFPSRGLNKKDEIIFIGCYSCDYTREVYPYIKKLVNKYDINYIFTHYPIHSGTEYLSVLDYCAYKQDRDKFWKLVDVLYATDKEKLTDKIYINTLVDNLGFNIEDINKCVDSDDTKKEVEKQEENIRNTNFYGTPTVFINSEALVGPKPYRVYERMLNFEDSFLDKLFIK